MVGIGFDIMIQCGLRSGYDFCTKSKKKGD